MIDIKLVVLFGASLVSMLPERGASLRAKSGNEDGAMLFRNAPPVAIRPDICGEINDARDRNVVHLRDC
jgi:hypothetical protein